MGPYHDSDRDHRLERAGSSLVEQEDQERHQMTRDATFAQGCRLAWRYVPITMLVAVLSFMALGAIGNFADRIETANAIQRIAQ